MNYRYLIPLCIAVSVIFLIEEHRERHVLGVFLKGLASLVFVAFGCLGSRGCPDRLFADRVLAGDVSRLHRDSDWLYKSRRMQCTYSGHICKI